MESLPPNIIHIDGEEVVIPVDQEKLDIGFINLALRKADNAMGLARYLDSGANIEAKDVDGETALHAVVYRSKVRSTALLLQRGANPNALGLDEWSPLHYASKNHQHQIDIIELLIEHGGNPNTTNKDGDTPLHVAFKNYNLATIPLLLKNSSNPYLKNKEGKTPMSYFKGLPDHIKRLEDLRGKPVERHEKNLIKEIERLMNEHSRRAVKNLVKRQTHPPCSPSMEL
jgi:hypothetical protein